MGCGVCIDKCDQEAIMLVEDEDKGVPLDICALLVEVAMVKSAV